MSSATPEFSPLNIVTTPCSPSGALHTVHMSMYDYISIYMCLTRCFAASVTCRQGHRFPLALYTDACYALLCYRLLYLESKACLSMVPALLAVDSSWQTIIQPFVHQLVHSSTLLPRGAIPPRARFGHLLQEPSANISTGTSPGHACLVPCKCCCR